MIVHKTYKVHLYPNKEQEEKLLKILSACRFVWNYFLEKRRDYYLDHKKKLTYNAMSRELTQLKKEAKELEGIQSIPLQQALRRLDVAYNRFFRKLSRFPRFKADWNTVRSFDKVKNWSIEGNKIRIQSDIAVKFRGTIPKNYEKLGGITVKNVAGSWFASIKVQEDIEPLKEFGSPKGIDVGLSNLAITSDGEKYDTLKPGYKLHHKMRVLQQKLARQEVGSNRREQTKLQIARLYQKIKNVRINHIHQATKKILESNPSLIAIEDLNVAGLTRSRKLARSLNEVSLGELHRQLKYKQEWRGGKVVEIDRFFPSTKTCSGCGYINQDMTLAIREWECPKCGAKHDRDINAAKMILKQGINNKT